MCKTMLIGVVSALLVLVLGAVCTEAQSDSDKARRTLTFIADAPNGTSSVIDLGQPGDSQGDILVFDEPLLNEERQNIGTNSGFCIRTRPGRFNECQWTLTLADGTITVAGRVADRSTSRATIVGGTGAFVGVSGEMAFTSNADGTFTQVLMLRKGEQ